METAGIWDVIVQMHSTTDWSALTLFYGGILLVGYLVVAEVLRIRTNTTTNRVDRRAEDLEEELKNLRARQKRMVNYMKEQMDDQAREHEWKMEELRRRMGKVEDRIPSLYDHLDEFRTTLSSVLEKELASVMHSFDSSVDSVLDQMQEQLETGIKNIEGIKSMVRNRKKAEHNLLQSADLSTLQEAGRAEPGELPETVTPPEVPDDRGDEMPDLEQEPEPEEEAEDILAEQDEGLDPQLQLTEGETESGEDVDEEPEPTEAPELTSEHARKAPAFVDDYESWLAAQQALETHETHGSDSEPETSEGDEPNEDREEAA